MPTSPSLPPSPRLWHAALAAGLLVLMPPAGAAGPAAMATAAPLQATADGKFVIDTRARLAWPRCVEGMAWNGHTCTGAARLMTYGEAQALVRERGRAEGVRWRLPRVNELRRLVNPKASPPGVDRTLFPAAPPDWHWTGTASVNTTAVNPYAYGTVQRGGAAEGRLSAQQGWAVDMEGGEARGDVGRATRLPVRLVRPAP